MDVQKLGVKIFAIEPVSIAINDFIPVFHSWIQRRAIENHLLIDVHDYSHIYRGPGILLVAHEGNFSLDMADGRIGLLYTRKQPIDGTAVERLSVIMKTALDAARLLEREERFNGRLQFNTNEILIVSNDRLNAPNDAASISQLEPVAAAGFNKIFGGTARVESASPDPNERLALRVITSATPNQR